MRRTFRPSAARSADPSSPDPRAIPLEQWLVASAICRAIHTFHAGLGLMFRALHPDIGRFRQRGLSPASSDRGGLLRGSGAVPAQPQIAWVCPSSGLCRGAVRRGARARSDQAWSDTSSLRGFAKRIATWESRMQGRGTIAWGDIRQCCISCPPCWIAQRSGDGSLRQRKPC
jgi:hypothetical protein